RLLVRGCRMLIIGDDAPFAQDLSRTLVAAGALIERAPSLLAAVARARPEGLSLWLLLPSITVPSLAVLRSLVRGTASSVRFVVLGRGGRRQARVQDVDQLSIDLDVLSRRTLLRALALASGRLQVQVAEATADPAPAATGSYQRLSAPGILVAEDNATNREVIRRQLQVLGYKAQFCVDGQQALDLWRTASFGLILTDVRMPNLDGCALARAIRAEEGRGHRTAIVALTANALAEDRKRCAEAGMDDYLVKPTHLPQLQATLEKWLRPAEPATDVLTMAAGTVAPVVDLSVLAGLIGDDPADIRAVLAIFCSTSKELSAELERAISSGSAVTVAELAHKLKSGALSIGAQQLGALSIALESGAHAKNTADLMALWPAVKAELDAVWLFLAEDAA
ncbi:MAG: response regulator, partial [Burkholderiaceae bacterium]